MAACPRSRSSRCALTCTRTGTQSRAVQAHSVPGLGARDDQGAVRAAGWIATGHEALDADTSARMDSETYILQHGHYQIEAMANLDQVPATGALIVVTWPKVRGGLGFPARAFAIAP